MAYSQMTLKPYCSCAQIHRAELRISHLMSYSFPHHLSKLIKGSQYQVIIQNCQHKIHPFLPSDLWVQRVNQHNIGVDGLCCILTRTEQMPAFLAQQGQGSICNMPVSSAKGNNRNYLMIQMAFEKVLRSWQELSKGKLKEAFQGEDRSQCRRRKGKTVAGNCEETSLNKYRGKMGRKSKTGNVDTSPILQGFNSQFEGFLSNFV